MSADGQKTEKATPRRLERARKDGSFVSSKELVSGVQYLTFAFLMIWGLQTFFAASIRQSRAMLQMAMAPADVHSETLVYLFRSQLAPSFAILAAAGFALTLAAFIAQMAASRLGISGNKIAPDLKRLNPMSRLKELPSQNLFQAARALFLLPVFLYITWWLVEDRLNEFLRLPLVPWAAGVASVGAAISDLLRKAIYVFAALAIIDWIRQTHRYNKQLRMSKQEIRDEHKEVEGNPQLRARVRRMQRDLSRKRMMSDVPKASAVIVNPTHYAVAIRYDLSSMAAPRVVAKGRNHLALRIKKLAIQNQVPIIENPPLARALYAAADVGQDIPPHLFKAVAEILAYLYRLLGGRLPGQSAA
jgi:flagellar biosynthesis protein FlhB